jgi:hypothetical protein
LDRQTGAGHGDSRASHASRSHSLRRRAFRDRSFGNRAFRNRPFGDCAFRDRSFGNRAFRNRPFGDCAFRDRSFGNRAFRDRSFGNRAFHDRPFGNRAFHDRPFGACAFHDRPARNRAPHSASRAASAEGPPPAAADLPHLAGRTAARLTRSSRPGRLGPSTLPRVIFLRTARPLPSLTCDSRHLAGSLGLAFGFFEALACALELILRDAYPLLGDVGLQAHPLQWFGRGTVFAACLLHLGPAKRKTISVTQGPAPFHLG